MRTYYSLINAGYESENDLNNIKLNLETDYPDDILPTLSYVHKLSHMMFGNTAIPFDCLSNQRPSDRSWRQFAVSRIYFFILMLSSILNAFSHMQNEQDDTQCYRSPNPEQWKIGHASRRSRSFAALTTTQNHRRLSEYKYPRHELKSNVK